MTTTRRLAWLQRADRYSPWHEASVVVAGLGSSGFAAADALLEVGARVIVVDDLESDENREKATLLEHLDATVHLGPGASAHLPAGTDLVIASPGWHPDYPLLAAAAATGVPIWVDVELAWRLMHPDRIVPYHHHTNAPLDAGRGRTEIGRCRQYRASDYRSNQRRDRLRCVRRRAFQFPAALVPFA